jgi:hypothetical protein
MSMQGNLRLPAERTGVMIRQQTELEPESVRSIGVVLNRDFEFGARFHLRLLSRSCAMAVASANERADRIRRCGWGKRAQTAKRRSVFRAADQLLCPASCHTIADLIKFAQRTARLELPLIDKTGLTGLYSIPFVDSDHASQRTLPDPHSSTC